MSDNNRLQAPGAPAETHQVFNQSVPLEDYNLFSGDTALKEGLARHGAGWAREEVLAFGALCGRRECWEWGFLANEYRPQFRSHDRQGFRVDEVRYHDAYHQLMRQALGAGLHSAPWLAPGAGAHVARAARYYCQAQVESGHGCPVTMTFAAVPTLGLTPAVAESWLPRVLANDYDPRNLHHSEKSAVTIGMGMTEKQGGSDVRSNTTRAEPLVSGRSGPGARYTLWGHKWFTSAPMCDAFLMLAQAPGGLSCFLVPRWREDGGKNPVQVQRLKNKMGNVSNASSEIELRDAEGWMVGEEGRGVAAIIEMVAMTRFDCMIGSAAAQRQCVVQALNHCRGRSAFGRSLDQQPLMRNVLADLQLEVEGSLALMLRMGEALDRSLSPGSDTHERHLLRLGLPTGKYWICKRTPHLAYEAMECLGGNGVIEDFLTARLYRDAPINAIWEGSGNVQALDMLRALERSPVVLDAWLAELASEQGADRRLDQAIARLRKDFADDDQREYRARYLVDQLALTMQAALLVRSGNVAVAEAFIASRLAGEGGSSVGSLPRGVDTEALMRRADPLQD